MGQYDPLIALSETLPSTEAAVTLRRIGAARNTPVIYCHIRGSNQTEPLVPSAGLNRLAEACARAGYPVVSANLNGGVTWGASSAVSRVGQAASYAATAYGSVGGKVILAGVSMGFLAACNWAKNNKAQVAGIIGGIYDCDLTFSHDTLDTGSWTAEINAAYGSSAAYASSIPFSDPKTYGPSFLASIPMLLIRSTDETQGVPSIQGGFASAMGQVTEVTEVLQTGGHSMAGFDDSTVEPFLQRYAG